jgi:SAM-dependent methyltransferase
MESRRRHSDGAQGRLPTDPVAESLGVGMLKAVKALAKAIDAAIGDVSEKGLDGGAPASERGATPLDDRVRAERTALRYLMKARNGLDEAVAELHAASLGEAASALVAFDATHAPIKHRVRKVDDETIRRVLLEELRRRREREIVELIDARAVRWEAPLRTEPPIGVGMDERVVELPIAHQFLEVHRDAWVLDAGASLNLPFFRATLGDDSPRLVHLTQSGKREPALFDGDRASYVFGDLRQIPFQKKFFDRVLCISTLEHVGLDNTRYGAPRDNDPGSYVSAVREMARVLVPGGKLLITVPVGVPRSLSWFQVFGRAALQKVQRTLRGLEIEIRFFAYRGSWVDVEADEALAEQGKGEAVGAVAALVATRPGLPQA